MTRDRRSGAGGRTRPGSSSLEPFIATGPVDVTAFMGQWPWRLSASATTADIGAYASRMDLAQLWVSHLASVFGYDTRTGNEALFDACAQDERLRPFVIVNPTEDGWAHELEWAHGNGTRGVRIVPGYQGYRLDTPEVDALLADAAERGLPLHVCATLEDHRVRHPRYAARAVSTAEIAGLLRRAIGVRVVISGLRANEWASVEAQLGPDHPLDLVLVDLWFMNGPVGVVGGQCAAGRAHRLAYGSCFPVQTPEATAYQLASADIGDADRLAMCRGNADRLLSAGD
jgi:predicted TIM-barrel fold metal-dependent hydrolase